MTGVAPPLPPVALRQLVGPLEDHWYDNPSGQPVFEGLPVSHYRSVVDFGCGCGRLARQLLQQSPRPDSYLGLDLHAGMIAWCERHLAKAATGFSFRHHDVHNPAFNPESTNRWLPLPVKDGSVTLVLAWSVFTHLVEAQARFYLGECARSLAEDGVLLSTWFLFDKADFPMMQDFQNAVFINDIDPSNAVLFDRRWVLRTLREAGLTAFRILPPRTRGFQWQVWAAPTRAGVIEADFPADTAPPRHRPPPLLPEGDVPRLGFEDD